MPATAPRSRPHRRRRVAPVAALCAIALAGGLLPGLRAGGAAAAGPEPATTLTLVTLTGGGTASTPGTAVDDAVERVAMLARQDALLARLGAGVPVYRWTTAIDGVAVPLTAEQAAAAAADPDVALVEADSVRRLSAGAPAADDLHREQRRRGGAGVVVGVVDSGITPGTPVFADVPGLGRAPDAFRGGCAEGEDWPATTCQRKLVGAAWFVAGFGADRVRSTESLSPRDTLGHGTQVASVAAGNAGVTVRVGARRAGTFGGVAPQARVAAYKACWAAPDPADDGCSTADLVSAVDRAVADGVDVLNLAVEGSTELDTVERALLGAAEADIVVVAAAGNDGRRSFAAHTSPWVTTVGALSGGSHRAAVALRGGPRLVGAGRPGRTVGPARILRGGEVAAAGARRLDARRCVPGSLDAARVAGAVVVCERGTTGRVDKSAAVAAADGVGMVLVNTRAGGVADDFHAVPTVHLAAADGRRLLRWLRTHEGARARVQPVRGGSALRVPRWTPQGDPTLGSLKPDLLAPATGVLGAGPDLGAARRWSLTSGTSAAAAQVSGQAALLRSRHDWPATSIRSALVTTASGVGAAAPLRRGAGRVHDGPVRVGLVLEVDAADYRRALDGTLSTRALNTPTILVTGRQRTLTRRVTNVGARAEYFSLAATGFTRHGVRLTPAALRLAPGESATITLVVRGPETAPLDAGTVTLTGARGSTTRLPVVIAR